MGVCVLENVWISISDAHVLVQEVVGMEREAFFWTVVNCGRLADTLAENAERNCRRILHTSRLFSPSARVHSARPLCLMKNPPDL